MKPHSKIALLKPIADGPQFFDDSQHRNWGHSHINGKVNRLEYMDVHTITHKMLMPNASDCIMFPTNFHSILAPVII
jgi:tellurite resistance-related uncharacterized protein